MAIIKSKREKREHEETRLAEVEEGLRDDHSGHRAPGGDPEAGGRGARRIDRPLPDAPLIKKEVALSLTLPPQEIPTEQPKRGGNDPDEVVEISSKGGVRRVKRAPSQEAGGTLSDPSGAQPTGPTPEQLLEEAKQFREEAQALLARARDEAARVMADAQAKAKKLMEQAKLYCQSIESTAGREGFEIGREEGRKAGYEEVANLMEETRRTLRQALGERDRLIHSVENEAAKLAVKIAERIVGSEVRMRSEIVLEMIRATLEKVKDREHVTIHVHQEDLDYAKEHANMFARMVEGIKSFEIQADPRVDRGGCIIETNLGSVDARISTKLAAIEAAFQAVEREERDADALD